MPFFPKRLFAQLVLLLSLILVSTVVSFGWIAGREQAAMTLKVIHSNIEVMARGLGESSAHYLVVQDYAGLGEFLVRAAEFPNVKRITVYEPDGAVVAEAERKNSHAEEVIRPRTEKVPAELMFHVVESSGELVTWVPVMTSSLIGWVKLSYGLEAIAEAHRAIWMYTAMLLSAWVPIGILLLSLVVRRPVSTIGRLSSFARRLSTVRGEQMTGRCPSVELAVLQESLNAASSELQERERQLNGEREELRLNEERFEALYQLSRMAGSSEDAIAEFALEQAVLLTRSGGGYLHFFNEDEETIGLYRWSRDVLTFCTATRESHYPLSRAGVWADSVRLRKPVVHNDFAAVEGKKGYPEGHFEVRRHMSIPVIDGDRIVAVAGVGNKEQPYDDSDILQLRMFMNEMWQHLKRMRAEQEMLDLQVQLQQSQKMEAIGHLAGGIAHDFNNLLTAIIGYGSVLKVKLSEDDPLRMHADQVILASQKAADLTRGLLAFSRKQIINPLPTDVNEIVRGIGRILQRVIGEDIQLRIEMADQPLTVLVDKGQIDQVLMNLATNARDAMPSGGTLSIGTSRFQADEHYVRTHLLERAGPYAVITVSDTGRGMDRETQEHIFEPFFTTKEAGRGTGLGLAIVFGIVKQHNGSIKLYSEPGRGSSFKIFLPLTGAQPAGPAELAEFPRGGTETILIAEDEESIRSLLSLILADAGYRVIEAKDGDEAVDAFREHRDMVALLLLDVIMPRRTGRQALDLIRAEAPGMRALFMSGYSDGSAEVREVLAQGMEFLTKPIEPRVLLERVRSVLDGR